MTSPLQPWERRFLPALLFACAALRVLFLSEVKDNPFFNNPTSDAYYYDAQAQSIAAGDVLGRDVFFRAPGYPYWLALIYAMFGHDYVVVRVIQHLLGVLAILLVYLLARRMFDPTVAVVSSLLAAFYAVLIYFEGQLLFDWFLTVSCISWVLVFHQTREKPTWWRWFFTGLLFGCICVIRPLFLPLGLPILGYEVWRWYRLSGREHALRTGGALILGASLSILPVTIRNYLVSGDFVLIASQGGINFYIGNNSSADGYSARIPTDIGASWEISEMSFFVGKEVGHRASPSEESDFWYAKGFEFMFSRPLAWTRLLLKKAYLFWNAIEIPNNLDFYTFSQYSWLLRALPVGFWLVGPLGMFGMVLAWHRRRGRSVVAFVLMYCAVVVAFFVCDRYRLPVVPLLCIFSACALVALFKWLASKQYRRFLVAMPALGACALFVNSNIYSIEREEPVHQFYLLGLIEQKQGHYAGAASYYERAASFGKPIRNLYLHWGTAELMAGHDQSAKEKLRQELSHHPDSYGALAVLSEMFLGKRILDSAAYYGSRAVAVRPYMPSAYISVGQSFLLRGDAAAAESVLSIGSLQCGNAFSYGNYLLAGICLGRGDIGRADTLYRSILRPVNTMQGQGYEAEFLIPEEKKIGIDRQTLSAKAWYGLGHVFAARRQLDSAAAYFTTATILTPTLADAWADLGVALLQLRRFTGADSALNRALGLQPKNFMYWYNYASLLGATGRLAGARDALKRTLTLRPDFVPAQRDLELLSRAGAAK